MIFNIDMLNGLCKTDNFIISEKNLLKTLKGSAKMRTERGKPRKRKEGKEMQSTSAFAPVKQNKPSGISWRFHSKKKNEMQAEPDRLLRDDLSKFERNLIIECREIGMSDEDIQKWLQEI